MLRLESNPCRFRGTDVSYASICSRRVWLSIHEIFITEDSDYVKEGRYLSERERNTGVSQVQLDRNRIDNLEISGEEYKIHEYKRGKKLLKADMMQLFHYMNCLESKTGKMAKGYVHLLSSREVRELSFTKEYLEELNRIYQKIDGLADSNMPDAVRNYFCLHGCSFRDFCWG